MIEKRRDLAARCRGVVDGAAEPSELSIFGMECAVGSEDGVPINGLSGRDQFALHVDAEQGIESGGRDLVGAATTIAWLGMYSS